MDQEHIRSGRFIHDELLLRAEQAVDRLPLTWRDTKHIHAVLLLWPTMSVKAQKGERHSGVVYAELPLDPADRPKFIRQAVAGCEAYAILVVEEIAGAVRAIFESAHGTVTWRLPIKDHGGTRVLGVAAKSSNTESVGVLWRAN
jgi:hypothetical protein